MEKKNKRIKIANMPAEWAVQLVSVAVQLAGLVLIIGLAKFDNITIWIIVSVLSLTTVYFTAMLFYKLYRARLAVVAFGADGISFRYAFKKIHIPAARVVIELINYGKKSKKKFYVQISDSESNVATIVSLDKKRVIKLIDNAPPALPELFVSICDTQTLKDSLTTAMPSLVPYIEEELREREAAAAKAQNKSQKRKKHKK